MPSDVQLKPQVYKDDRPAEYFEQFHRRARRGPSGWTYELTRAVVVPYMLTFLRARSIGSENVPNGPVILAPNHGSFVDHFLTGAFLRRRVRFMAKSQLFGTPGTYIFSHGGVFPIRRGHQDEAAFDTSFLLLDRGEAIVMYCEGGRSRTGKMADQAKPGIGRLAIESGAPVVPVAILNSYKIRNWKRLRFPKVIVQFGQPFRFERREETTREQQQEAADYILERIRALHTELTRMGYQRAKRRSTAAGEGSARETERGVAPASVRADVGGPQS